MLNINFLVLGHFNLFNQSPEFIIDNKIRRIAELVAMVLLKVNGCPFNENELKHSRHCNLFLLKFHSLLICKKTAQLVKVLASSLSNQRPMSTSPW